MIGVTDSIMLDRLYPNALGAIGLERIRINCARNWNEPQFIRLLDEPGGCMEREEW